MIAQGRNEIKAEIDYMYDAYKSLLSRLQRSYQDELICLDKTIKEFRDDNKLSYEERRDFIRPYENKIDETLVEEQNSQLLLFSCVYSYWEKALQKICEYYQKKIVKKAGIKNEKISINYSPKIKDYLSQLLDENAISLLPKPLIAQYDELRNYSIHGTLSPKRMEILKQLEIDNEIELVEKDGKFFFSSFDGLKRTLDIIYETLIKIIKQQEAQ